NPTTKGNGLRTEKKHARRLWRVSGRGRSRRATDFGTHIKVARARLIADGRADRLDAVLCAIQAAWSYTRKGQNYGMVEPCETEGWIVDPALCRIASTMATVSRFFLRVADRPGTLRENHTFLTIVSCS